MFSSSGSYEVIFYDGFKKLVQPINMRPMVGEPQVWCLKDYYGRKIGISFAFDLQRETSHANIKQAIVIIKIKM